MQFFLQINSLERPIFSRLNVTYVHSTELSWCTAKVYWRIAARRSSRDSLSSLLCSSALTKALTLVAPRRIYSRETRNKFCYVYKSHITWYRSTDLADFSIVSDPILVNLLFLFLLSVSYLRSLLRKSMQVYMCLHKRTQTMFRIDKSQVNGSCRKDIGYIYINFSIISLLSNSNVDYINCEILKMNMSEWTVIDRLKVTNYNLFFTFATIFDRVTYTTIYSCWHKV